MNRELDVVQADYNKRLTKLLGRSGMLELDAIRNRKLNRAQKKRRVAALLKELDVEPSDISDVRRRSHRGSQELTTHPAIPLRVPYDPPCGGPVVTYTPPYRAYYWEYHWQRSSNARVPLMDRYVNSDTGRVGSRLRTSVAHPDNDDRVSVEYYTGINFWHVPQSTGPLEIVLTFAFPEARFAGKITDEIGFSDCTISQFAEARIRVVDSQDPTQFADSSALMISRSRYLDGHDARWDELQTQPYESRSYRLKTLWGFTQGSTVLIDAGVNHVTRFTTDDESVSSLANVDLILARVDVSSCPPEIIL